MIIKKEFYFIRHGQTDYNLLPCKVDHEDVSLNATGFQQAQAVEAVIATLPVKSICFSPLKRAKETTDAISLRLLEASHYETPDLGECSLQVWSEMMTLGCKALQSPHPHVKSFMQKTLNGLNSALSYEGPTLIVAHGGIHWAMCCLMGISDHDWLIDNCLPVHFYIGSNNQWAAKKMG